MSDDEAADQAEGEGEDQEPEASSSDVRKGPAKCFGGAPKRGSLIRVGFPCRTTGTARPTAIFQCMSTQRKDLCSHPQEAPKSGPGAAPAMPQNPVDTRGADNYPPQGGTLLKTCGVKAQFTGEIIIKKDIPPRPPQCQPTQCQLNSPNTAPPPQFEEPVKERTCPSPQHHHQAPICQVPPFPAQPEINEECRRILRARGPDSSRFHPECPCVCPIARDCGCEDYEPSCRDFDAPERQLHPGEEERFETVRTREEIMLDPQDDQCPHTQALTDDQCAKYVRTEDTFRRTRSYNPPADCFPPPVLCCQPETGCQRQCQECPPRCPGTWEGPPCQEDGLASAQWRQQFSHSDYEPSRCAPPCNPEPMSPMMENGKMGSVNYSYNAPPFPC